MLRHPGLIYLFPFALPLLALAQPTRHADGLQRSGRAMRHLSLQRRDAGHPGAVGAVLVPVNSQFIGADGITYTLSGTLSLQGGAVPPPPPPPPPPEPLTITAVTIQPNTIPAGAGSTGTVTLSRSPGVAVLIGLWAEKGLTTDPSLTIQPGQTSGTFAVKSSGTGGTWLSVIASYNGQSKLASMFVQATPLPPPPVPTGTQPVINGVQNADGSPLVIPAWGQEARIVGLGFGTTLGKVTWQGGNVPVTVWSDTEVRVRLPLPAISGGQEFSVVRPDGLYSDLLLPGMVPGRRR